MQTVYQLAICIPVYNCGGFISQAIDSVVAQFTDQDDSVQLVILDGGSTDNTDAVVATYTAKYPNIVYEKQLFRGGIDTDMDRVVRLSRAEYCVLLSGDDRLRPGSIRRIMQSINQFHDDLYLCKHASCDYHLRQVGQYQIFINEAPFRLQWRDTDARLSYLANAVNSEAVFSFMSGLVVRRLAWISVDVPIEHMSSCWGHVSRFLAISKNSNLAVNYTDDCWVDKRDGHDSFSSNGMVKRLSIAVDGLPSIFSHYYGEQSQERQEVRRLVRNDVSFVYWLNAKSRTFSNRKLESIHEFNRMKRFIFSDAGFSGWMRNLILSLAPASALHAVRRLVRAFK